MVSGQVPYGVRAAASASEIFCTYKNQNIHKKNEYFSEHIRNISDMVYGDNQKNMPSNEGVRSSEGRSGSGGCGKYNQDDDEFDEYDFRDDGCDFNDFRDDGCDFNDFRDDGDFKDSDLGENGTHYGTLCDKYDVEEVCVDYTKPMLQDPDTMEFIRPARLMPSIEEMNACWDNFINGDRYSKMSEWAVLVLTKWWMSVLEKRRKLADRKYHLDRTKEVAEWLWKKRPIRNIIRVTPCRPFEELFAEMRKEKDAIDTKTCAVDATKRSVFIAAKLNEDRKKNGIERAIKKIGMNKNSSTHISLRCGALIIGKSEQKKGACDSFIRKECAADSAGTGRRFQRKLRLEKEAREEEIRLERVAKAAIFAPIAEEKVDLFPPEEEVDDEQKALDMAESVLVNIACIAKADREEKDAVIAAENAEQEKQELAEESVFVSVMAGNMGLEVKTAPVEKTKKVNKKIKIVLVGKGLIDQAVEKRCIVDEKYKVRCDAFGDLADSSKLETVLKFTKLCRSVRLGKKCFHKECRFAHSIDQLTSKDCRFGADCRFVKLDADGSYKNKVSSSGKTCDCVHPNENQHSFAIRMGVKPITQTVVKTAAAPMIIPLHIKTGDVTNAGYWSRVVEKAEIESKANIELIETKVDQQLSNDEKVETYGKGVTMLGDLSDISDKMPIIVTELRKPYDKSGLGFSSDTKNVLVSGFNWVIGGVLLPPKRERAQKLDVKPAYITAIEIINDRISKQEADIAQRVLLAQAKAIDINERLANDKRNIQKADISQRVLLARSKVDDINERLANDKRNIQKADISQRVLLARSKADDINQRLVKSTTSTESSTVFRVSRAGAKMAVISAINSGILDFRIELIDEESDEYSSDSSSGYSSDSSY
jgi:hypothetical protein